MSYVSSLVEVGKWNFYHVPKVFVWSTYIKVYIYSVCVHLSSFIGYGYKANLGDAAKIEKIWWFQRCWLSWLFFSSTIEWTKEMKMACSRIQKENFSHIPRMYLWNEYVVYQVRYIIFWKTPTWPALIGKQVFRGPLLCCNILRTCFSLKNIRLASVSV